AHELEGPLRSVSANANYCREAVPPELLAAATRTPGSGAGDWLGALQAVDEGVERIREVVRDVTTFGRASRGDDEPTSDVARVIEAAIHLAHHAAGRCATIVREPASEALRASIPANRLAQVVLNLLLNAAHACADRDGGRGTIAVR